MPGYFRCFGALILAMLFAATPVADPALAQGKRVALVIGNAAYQHTSRLQNPRNDANDVAGKLKALDFVVVEGQDLDKAGTERTIRNFAAKLAGADVGLFFYAGHGLQVAGQNYLVPIDAKLDSASAIDFEMVRLDLVLRAMERETRTNIIVIDACRDNPLARNLARALGTRSADIGRGLASVESGEGTLISFSTQPGNVALDGEGRNSPFATALLQHIATPGDDLSTILINVRNDVMKATARRQVPWEHSAMTAKFHFIAPAPSVLTDDQEEVMFWASVKDSGNTSIVGTYLERYPAGRFAPIARAMIEGQKHQPKVGVAERETEKGDPAAKVVALPKGETPAGGGGFDGRWELKTAGAGCAFSTVTVNFVVTAGDIRDYRGPGQGKVEPSGAFNYQNRPKVNPSGPLVSFTGTLRGNAGSGTFYQSGGSPCKGTFTVQRK